eukprot:956472-Prymnesium_polylepis.1
MCIRDSVAATAARRPSLVQELALAAVAAPTEAEVSAHLGGPLVHEATRVAALAPPLAEGKARLDRSLCGVVEPARVTARAGTARKLEAHAPHQLDLATTAAALRSPVFRARTATTRAVSRRAASHAPPLLPRPRLAARADAVGEAVRQPRLVQRERPPKVPVSYTHLRAHETLMNL